jgi:hypothetical protein
MSQERLNDELAAIEAALCSLTPAATGCDRDRLMFLAGRASAKGTLPLECGDSSPLSVERFEPPRHACHAEKKAAMNRRTPKLLWPIATAGSLALAATFGILWAGVNNPKPVERTAELVVAPMPMTVDLPADTLPPSPWANRHLCQLVLEKGIDAMPEWSANHVSGVLPVPREDSYRKLLKQYLDNPTG